MQMRHHKGKKASPRDRRHHVQGRTGGHRNRYKRGLFKGDARLPTNDHEGCITCAQVSCDRKRQPRLGCESKTRQQEDRKRNPVKLEPIIRDAVTQKCGASLKDAEDLEIDKPTKSGAGRIFKSARSELSPQRSAEKRERTQELQFEKTIHKTANHK